MILPYGTTLTTLVLQVLNAYLDSIHGPTVEKNQPVCISYRMLTSNYTCLYSFQYKKVKCTNSYTITYGSHQYGQICYFVHVFDYSYTIIHSFYPVEMSTKQYFNISHIALDCTNTLGITAAARGPLICIPITDNVKKCVFMDIDGTFNIATFLVSRARLLPFLRSDGGEGVWSIELTFLSRIWPQVLV